VDSGNGFPERVWTAIPVDAAKPTCNLLIHDFEFIEQKLAARVRSPSSTPAKKNN
jgi:hypothetical protein